MMRAAVTGLLVKDVDVDVTRPVWALMPRGAPRDMSPRGVVKQMAEILAAVAPALPSAGETE